MRQALHAHVGIGENERTNSGKILDRYLDVSVRNHN